MKKNKKIFFYICIVAMLTTIILSLIVSFYALSKYMKQLNQNSNADVARWYFDIKLRQGKDGAEATTETINMASTMFTHVADGKIAPGTSGEFEIIIDTRGTEVSMRYDVAIVLNNCPRNITFSRVDSNQNETVISEGGSNNSIDGQRILNFNNYVPLEKILEANNQDKTFVERIKWDWPYELTNGTDDEKNAYNQRDKEDSGKTVQMNITVEGSEVFSVPKVGDFVNYTPSQINEYVWRKDLATSTQTGTVIMKSGENQEYNIDEWRILDIDGDTVRIVPTTVKNNVSLEGTQGYNNGVKLLNDACNSLYSDRTKGITARSINVADIEYYIKKSGNVGSLISAQNTWGYGTKRSTQKTTSPSYPVIYALEHNIMINDVAMNVGEGEGLDLNEQTKIIERTAENNNTGMITGASSIYPIQTWYYISNLRSVLGTKYSNIINVGSYWFATRAVSVEGTNSIKFVMRSKNGSSLSSWDLSSNTGVQYPYSSGMFPVVTLKLSQLQETTTDGTYTVK